jgi:hypothetical protein
MSYMRIEKGRDTLSPSTDAVTVNARIRVMALPGRTRRQRPTKGERHLIGARLPIADAVKLADVVEARGTTVSEYVAELLHAHLSTVDLEQITNQEALPIAQAS